MPISKFILERIETFGRNLDSYLNPDYKEAQCRSVLSPQRTRPIRLCTTPLVAHVERMLKLHANLAAAKTPDAQTHLSRDIAATDRAIDQLVYRLYGLTDDEIKLVEQATTPAPPTARTIRSISYGSSARSSPCPPRQ